jgi:hypothetical protein
MSHFTNFIDPITLDEGKPIPEYSVFDIESNDWIKLVMIGHYSPTDGFEKFPTIKSFLDYVVKGKKDRVIFAHNGGGFDFNFVLQDVICGASRKDYLLEQVMPRGATFLSIKISHKKTKIEIEFRDSLAMLPFSLKALTESFQTECAKGEWDHKNRVKVYDDEELTEYLKADCVGLYQVLDKYFNWPMIKGAGVAYTVASQALKVFRTFLDDRIPGCSTNVDLFVRKAYFGGRTEIFKPYFKGEKNNMLHVFDVNSLYPATMRMCDFPTQFRFFTKKYLPHELGFYEAEVEVPEGMYVPPLGVMISIDEDDKQVHYAADSSKGKFIFPTGRFKGVWSTVELNYAKKLGVKIISTGKGAIFKNGGRIFQKYVDSLYSIRKKAPKDSVDSFIVKLILNSSYGRFGLNLLREKLIFDDGVSPGIPSDYEFNTGETINGVPVIARFLRQEEMINSFSNVAIAAWVTANARITMHKEYVKHQDELYYTDTDSIFTAKQEESSPELGKFKYEYSAKEACFLLPKTYALEGIEGLTDKKGDIIRAKAVIKGINKEALKMRNVGINDLLSLLEGDFKRLKTPLLPLVFQLDARFAKVKTAMRKGTFLYVEPGKTKMLKSRYDKRVIYKKEDGTYDTVPIHIVDMKATNYKGSKMNILIEKKGKKKKVDFENDLD